MSLSPSSNSNSEPSHAKRKRAMSYASNTGSDSQYALGMHMHPPNGQYNPHVASSSTSATHVGPSSVENGRISAQIPKRGARACTACRKGKNRCEGEVSRLV
jgi:hypothetical protein